MATTDNIAELLHRLFSLEGFPHYVAHIRESVGDPTAFSIILSRLTREARRTYGTTEAQALFRRTLDGMEFDDTPGAGIHVTVPDAEFRMGDAERSVWDLTALVIQQCKRDLGAETAFTELFTRTAQLACPVFGPKDTKTMLSGLIDTMPEVAQFDM